MSGESNPRTSCQNAPWTLRYPARILHRTKDVLAIMPARRRQQVNGLIAGGALAICAGVAILFYTQDPAAVLGDPLLVAILAGLVVLAVLLFVIARVMVRRSGRAPVESQLLYYRLAGIPEPTERQLQALTLINFVVYPDGQWSETLEVAPVERRVRHVSDFAKQLAPFEVHPSQEFLAGLQEYWDVRTTEDVRNTIDSLFHGLHTLDFAVEWELATAEQRTLIRDRLCGLTGLPYQNFDACVARDAEHPPYLIWAWDLWRAIVVARNAFCADLIDEDEAWRSIHTAADLIYALYPDRSTYLTGMLLGHARWAGDPAACAERRREVDLATQNAYRWPVNEVPWVHSQLELPPHMATGFATEIDQVRAERT